MLVFLLGTISARAQSRFSIAPTYAITYGYSSNDVHFTELNTYHVYGPSYGSTVGLTTRFAITTKFDISLGALYNHMNAYLQLDEQLLTDRNTLQTYHNTSTSFVDNFQVPVLFNYRPSKNRLSPYLSAGALFTYQLGQHNQITDKHAVGTSAQFGAGVSYRINPKLSLIVQPTGSYLFKNGSNNLLLNGQQTIRSYQIGLQTQLVCHF